MPGTINMIDIERLIEDYEVFNPNLEPNTCNILEVWEHTPTLICIRVGPDVPLSRTMTFNSKTGILDGYENQDNPPRIRTKSRSAPTSFFQIRAGRPEWDKEDWRILEKYTDLDEAKNVLTIHQSRAQDTDSPFKFMMKKVVEDAPVYDYDGWADFRFKAEAWKPVPWAKEPWIKPELDHHHAHCSAEDSGRVAFWRDKNSAQQDVCINTTAGSYLNEFYGDVLTSTEIAIWVSKIDPPGDLVICESEPEAIYEAYAPYPKVSSCMAHRDESGDYNGNDWASGKNPVRVYGAGDLSVAQLIRKDEVVGRCLVWPEKKVAGRRYGDIHRLEIALREQGYTLDSEVNGPEGCGEGGFEGARLLKIPVEHSYMMPYLDHGYRVRDMGDHFVLSVDSGRVCHEVCGLLDGPGDRYTCYNCEESMDEDDAIYVQENMWCRYCFDEYAASCVSCGEYVETIRAESTDDGYYCRYCYSDLSTCDNCSDRVSDTEPVYDANDESVCGDWCSYCARHNTTELNGRLCADHTVCLDCDETHPDQQECTENEDA